MDQSQNNQMVNIFRLLYEATTKFLEKAVKESPIPHSPAFYAAMAPQGASFPVLIYHTGEGEGVAASSGMSEKVQLKFVAADSDPTGLKQWDIITWLWDKIDGIELDTERYRFVFIRTSYDSGRSEDDLYYSIESSFFVFCNPKFTDQDYGKDRVTVLNIT